VDAEVFSYRAHDFKKGATLMKPEEKKTPKAPADVDRLVAYRSLAAGDSYRVFWECLRKK
jgi:hypothetical protein